MGAKTCTARTFSAPGFSGFGDVEFVSAPGTGDVIGVGDLLSVEPDVGAVVDASEIQPDGFSRVMRRARRTVCDTTRRPRRDYRVCMAMLREISADGISDAGKLAEVHGEERVGEGFVLHQRRDDRGGHGDVVPSVGSECGGGNDLALGFDLGRGLQSPMIAERELCLCPAGRMVW